MTTAPSNTDDDAWIGNLEKARQYADAYFFMDFENEVPLTSPVKLVHCTEEALYKLYDDLGLYDLLVDGGGLFYVRSPGQSELQKEQFTEGIWVAPKYEPVMGPAIRQVLSGKAEDLYNDHFNPSVLLHTGETPLFRIVSYNREEPFNRMLRCHLDINARCNDGNTALHAAARNGLAPFVVRLLDLGADPNAANDDGYSPLHWAIKGLNTKIPPPIDAARILMERGANVNSPDKWKNTPLNFLLRWCPEQEELKALLLARGAVKGR